MCYKAQFYGIESHRCVQMTPTLKCNQHCLFCWRSFEHEVVEEEECPPDVIVANLRRVQKKALSGYKVSPYVEPGQFAEALDPPTMVAISLSGGADLLLAPSGTGRRPQRGRVYDLPRLERHPT